MRFIFETIISAVIGAMVGLAIAPYLTSMSGFGFDFFSVGNVFCPQTIYGHPPSGCVFSYNYFGAFLDFIIWFAIALLVIHFVGKVANRNKNGKPT